MVTLTAIVCTFWLCALLARPRKPLRGNEVQELVYSRLLGRQQTLMLLAVFATAAILIALALTVRPNRVDADLQSVRTECVTMQGGNVSCNLPKADGGLTKVLYPRDNTS